MIKRAVVLVIAFILIYTGVIRLQVVMQERRQSGQPKAGVPQHQEDPRHKVYSFSFSKYTPSGEKEIEIEGDSANILTKNVLLMNVVAKAYAEETPVTITADKGQYDKVNSQVYLRENVVATTEDGTRMMTEELDIDPGAKVLETNVQTEVIKDNINIEGVGARGDSGLKKVKFKKNVTVVVQDPENKSEGPTVITCDGPLVIDYEKNIAHFKDNVVAEDFRGKLYSDIMDVYYNRVSRRVSKIVAIGNVVIESPEGNQTFSDNVIYLADEGRVILGGDAEALYFKEEQFGDTDAGGLF
ncbi:MAG: LPS export ABC transporter periplasmic protein LptC [Omnitrophica bacterium GWA2_52_8]|nr:MAG: LPS export ABC transporter periplasmic protein LptC [Omnitrophica bacterium GWA2_52_8]